MGEGSDLHKYLSHKHYPPGSPLPRLELELTRSGQGTAALGTANLHGPLGLSPNLLAVGVIG